MSAFLTNKDGLTPRLLAEKISKSKYHRVIKNLKNYEAKETQRNAKAFEKKIKKVIVYEHEKSLLSSVVNNMWLSILIPLILAFMLYVMEKGFRSNE